MALNLSKDHLDEIIEIVKMRRDKDNKKNLKRQCCDFAPWWLGVGS